jgi:hypothetical protein
MIDAEGRVADDSVNDFLVAFGDRFEKRIERIKA